MVRAAVVARQRGEKFDANRSSSTSSIVIRQQTKQGRWLRLCVTLTSYSTSSGRLVLCLNHVLGYECTDLPLSTNTSFTAGHLHRVRHGPLSENAYLSQTTHDEQVLPPVKVESSMDRPASQSAECISLDNARDRTSMSRYWTPCTDLQLAWPGSFDASADRECHWPRNSKRRPISREMDEWSKLYAQRLTPGDMTGYQDVSNCNQLQQLLNCDSSYVTTIESAHSADLSAYVNLLGGNVVYKN